MVPPIVVTLQTLQLFIEPAATQKEMVSNSNFLSWNTAMIYQTPTEPREKTRGHGYFPLNPECLMTGSLVMVYEIIPI